MINTRDIIKEIEIANNWRLNDFSNIKNVYVKLSIDEKRPNNLQKYILTSAIPMIYAHWEGYVVTSLKIVFEKLNAEKLSYDETHKTLLTCAYEQKIKSLTDSKYFDKYQKHLNVILNILDNDVNFSKKIDTKSNLNFETLIDICEKLRFNSSNLEHTKVELNQLVNVRNALSHGENSYSFSKLEDIDKYFTLFYELSSKFLFEIESFFNEKKYLQ